MRSAALNHRSLGRREKPDEEPRRSTFFVSELLPGRGGPSSAGGRRDNFRLSSMTVFVQGKMSVNAPTIMVVDDDDDLRTLVEGLLRNAGYAVIGVGSGHEAHPLALKTLPDLIILDIGMPGMDGLTTLWKMRKHDELATVPVIILTAYESYDLRGEAASAGCHTYLTKPFEPVELKALVSKLLPLKQTNHQVRS